MSQASDQGVTWYPSKVDGWLRLLLWSMPLTSLIVLAISVASGDVPAIITAIIMCVFIAALYGLVVFPTRYGIAQDELIIQFGVFRHRLRLDAIKEVRPTRNPLSAPALSFDRLSIRSTNRSFPEALISPLDRESFYTALETRSDLRRDGDRLVRA